MNWLKEIGIVLANIIGIGQLIAPFLPPKVQAIEGKVAVVSTDIANLFSIIVDTEAQGVNAGMTGLQKLQSAVTRAQPLFVQTLSDAGLQFDPTKMEGVSSGLVQVMNGLVAIANSAQKK